jgi:hypothetical protein
MKAGGLGGKRRVRIYTTNASVPPAAEIPKPKRTQIGTDVRGLVVDSGTLTDAVNAGPHQTKSMIWRRPSRLACMTL